MNTDEFNLEEIDVKARWDELDRDRQTLLRRARECAELTIPSLMPPEGSTQDTDLPTPYQGLGSRGVNNLASKLLLTLLPPNNSFFRLMIDSEVIWELEEQGAKQDVEQQLSKIEDLILKEVEAKAIRVPVFEALKLLIVTGNALSYQPKEGGMEVFKLDQYVVKRNPMGDVLELIIKEAIDFYSLPEEIQNTILAEAEGEESNEEVLKKDYDLFTYVKLDSEKKHWNVAQECEGVTVEGSEGKFKANDNPYIPLRWTASSGEDYGRGLVEEYLGDFVSLESLSKAMIEGTTIASRIIGLVNPSGVTRVRKLMKASNGDFIEGNVDDVNFLQLDKHMDYSLVFQQIDKIETRLKYAFMVMDAIQRNAERVTAEEIRTMAREIESSLGGVYSLLSQEFQLPLIKRLMAQLQKENKLPELPKEVIEPVIITGLEALGRGHDLDKLMYFMKAIEPLGPQVVQQYVVHPEYMQRSATALGLDTEGLIKTQEQIQAEAQQAQKAQMMQQMGPEVMKAEQQAQIAQQQQQQQGGR